MEDEEVLALKSDIGSMQLSLEEQGVPFPVPVDQRIESLIAHRDLLREILGIDPATAEILEMMS